MNTPVAIRSSWLPAAALFFVLFAAAPEAEADGGVVRLRVGDGRVVSTLFTPADISQDMAAEFTVLVQDEMNGQTVLDAEVELRFAAPAGARLPVIDPWCRPPRSTLLAGPDGALTGLPPVRMTRSQSDNKLLHGVSLVFPVPGDWHGVLTVRHGTQMLSRDFTIQIGAPINRLSAVWPWLALPPFLIGMFIANQRLRMRR